MLKNVWFAKKNSHVQILKKSLLFYETSNTFIVILFLRKHSVTGVSFRISDWLKPEFYYTPIILREIVIYQVLSKMEHQYLCDIF